MAPVEPIGFGKLSGLEILISKPRIYNLRICKIYPSQAYLLEEIVGGENNED